MDADRRRQRVCPHVLRKAFPRRARCQRVEKPMQSTSITHPPPNILHEVLDVWFEQDIKPRLTGRAVLIRYADDAVLGFSQEEDARRVLPIPPHFVAFAWRYRSSRSCFAPVGGRAPPPQARGFGSPGCPSCRLPRGDDRLSQVPGEPLCAHALLFDPGGTSASGPLDASVRPSAATTTSAPTTPLSGLLHMACSRFVVAVTCNHPRLASDCWPSFIGRGWFTRWFPRKVSELVTSHPSRPGLSWRTSSIWTETYAKHSCQAAVVRRRQRADRRPARRDQWGRAAASVLRAPRLQQCEGVRAVEMNTRRRRTPSRRA